MKKIICICLCVFFLSTGCSVKNALQVKGTPGRTLKISLSYNTDSYPWILRTVYPQLAIWITYGPDEYKTVFVTQGAGKNKWLFADIRPGALPVWTGISENEKDLKIDAVTGATPSGDVHTFTWQIPEKLSGKAVSVFVEANVSFDYNEFYTKDEDHIGYSGVNGQPSMVWTGSFAVEDTKVQIVPEISGHGHVLGKDSILDPDNSHITTADKLFNYIRMDYDPGIK